MLADDAMCANNLMDLFEDGLKHMYYAEQQLVDATDELASQASDSTIEEAFADHNTETQEHVNRLEEVFDRIDASPETKQDNAVDGLIDNHEAFVEQDPDEHVLDRYNLTAGQKSEHYEIAAYGNLIPLADQLGMDEIADILEQNLREEQAALDKLSEIGEEFDYGQIPAE
jgi:ferritin-like metal-binding protein YciE